jgi:hypothetical protein
MQTISGLFDTYDHARRAVHALQDAGIPRGDISIVARHDEDYPKDEIGDDATTGAEIGAGLGAAGGLLAGLGIIAIPGLGAIAASGWLFATAIGSVAGAGIGAATGSLVGALVTAGVPEADAHVLAESVKRGGVIVSARVDDAHLEAARSILHHAEGADLATRRETYQQEGWSGFDETEPAETGEVADNEAGNRPVDRFPVIPPL